MIEISKRVAQRVNRLPTAFSRVPPEELPFPTDAQLDLLKAALLPADQAAPSWRRWKSRGLDIQTIDRPSVRMLPQLWTNREAAAIGEEDLPIFKGIYRQALALNAIRLAAALDVVRSLDEAGIPALFIKGAAIIAMAGERLGLRPMDDVDILVPEADAERAIGVLIACGFQSKAANPGIGIVHACQFAGPHESAIDLHWRALKTAGDDSIVFHTAREATLQGRQVRIPSVTECLLAVFGHAFWGGAPMRWIADAMFLLQIDGEPIDWDLLVERSNRVGLTLSLPAGLEFLAREFGVSVPADVLTELRTRRVHWTERAAYWAAIRGPRFAWHINQPANYRARRLHDSTAVPSDLLGHLAQAGGPRTGRRRDLLQYYVQRLLGAPTR